MKGFWIGLLTFLVFLVIGLSIHAWYDHGYNVGYEAGYKAAGMPWASPGAEPTLIPFDDPDRTPQRPTGRLPQRLMTQQEADDDVRRAYLELIERQHRSWHQGRTPAAEPRATGD